MVRVNQPNPRGGAGEREELSFWLGLCSSVLFLFLLLAFVMAVIAVCFLYFYRPQRTNIFASTAVLRPRISLKSQNLQPNEGSFVDVVCQVSSQPHPVIQWWLGDTEVTSLSGGVIQSNDSVNGLSTSTLRVNFTSEQDIASNYDCVRRNSSTEVVCTAFRCVAFYEGIKSRTLAVRSAVVTVKLGE